MRAYDCGSLFTVSVSRREVEAFKRNWPCSGLPDRAVSFQFDKRNGDLVDLWPDTLDGEAAVALSADACAYGARRLGLSL